ncbi:DUF3137 domain-containing protein [Aureispira anguillae]|uniref:DUF3137 domain-containing protein n=1 Tax=Aureispira anguillae TaxID=2864201 RepID=A0A916DRP7_9BACT|nr:DUF3137 domain-containing protein [Aureispira anguillae]BDS10331.1 DUF3137 domain-containing protein [Aureispira anguillae]
MDQQKIVNEVQPALVDLEQQRQKHLERLEKGTIYYGIATFLMFLTFLSTILIAKWCLLLGIVSVILVLVLRSFAIGDPFNDYKEEYKNNIIKRVVKMINPTVVYRPRKVVFKFTLEKSRILGKVNDFRGEDFFKGQTTKGYPFQFSEIHLMGEHSASLLYFKGLFFVMKNPVEMKGQILIFPKKINDPLDWIAPISSNKNQPPKIKYNPLQIANQPLEFKQKYVAYSNNHKEAVQVLTTAFLETIVELSEQWKTAFRIAFIEDKIYLALPSTVNYFEDKMYLEATHQFIVTGLYKELTKSLNVLEQVGTALEAVPKLKIELNKEKPKITQSNNWEDSAYNHFIDDEF